MDAALTWKMQQVKEAKLILLCPAARRTYEQGEGSVTYPEAHWWDEALRVAGQTSTPCSTSPKQSPRGEAGGQDPQGPRPALGAPREARGPGT